MVRGERSASISGSRHGRDQASALRGRLRDGNEEQILKVAALRARQAVLGRDADPGATVAPAALVLADLLSATSRTVQPSRPLRPGRSGHGALPPLRGPEARPRAGRRGVSGQESAFLTRRSRSGRRGLAANRSFQSLGVSSSTWEAGRGEEGMVSMRCPAPKPGALSPERSCESERESAGLGPPTRRRRASGAIGVRDFDRLGAQVIGVSSPGMPRRAGKARSWAPAVCVPRRSLSRVNLRTRDSIIRTPGDRWYEPG